ncbi:Multidrug resistance protein MdtE [Tepidimonas thermarum]|uniref:Multidrug resistance protein MdtE n=1 Tax=Tepidimonas thermarum TaxID=335431 RepID=A0A554X616_9BURK|nr:efflux RND transporter periplasmic adaptor subunit [Tepidimonas thermarum]TSE31275.1 Multidrug resistance protein MdtE [Tepidimonas thermarum]
MPETPSRTIAAHAPLWATLALCAALAGCQRGAPPAAADAPPLVRTAAVEPAGGAAQGLSGTVRAHVEAPLAFQVGGRIIARRVDAGQTVSAGQVLFELDPADLEQAVRAAQADAEAAETALRTAQSELARVRELQARAFVSAQALERAELALREAQSRRDAASARLTQARNARGYAVLRSPAAGVLIDVTGQPGQVVAAGQAVAVLAQQGAREVEVHFPDGVTPPAEGEALLPDGQRRALRLREAAPAVDPLGRTRRARYTVAELPPTVALGSVVATRFALPGAAAGEALWRVPVGALDERGQGPRVWRLRDGRLDPVAVQVRAVDDRQATVAGPLQAGERVVALGTHLLHDGMTVRELAR